MAFQNKSGASGAHCRMKSVLLLSSLGVAIFKCFLTNTLSASDSLISYRVMQSNLKKCWRRW